MEPRKYAAASGGGDLAGSMCAPDGVRVGSASVANTCGDSRSVLRDEMCANTITSWASNVSPMPRTLYRGRTRK